MLLGVLSYKQLLCILTTVLCHLIVLTKGELILYEQPLTSWEIGKELCQSLDGNLVTCSDLDDLRRISELLKKQKVESSWINGRQITSDWQWVNGNQIDFTAWHTLSAPSVKSDDRELCVTLYKDVSRSNLFWINKDCMESKGFICQFSFSSDECVASPQETISIDDCYTLHLTKTLTWFDARAFCHARQGELAVLDTQQLHNLVKQKLEQIDAFSSSTENFEGLWIGMHRNLWVKEDGTEIIGSFWSVGEPKVMNGCLQVVQINQDTYQWKSKNCDSLSSIVCETNSTETSTFLTTSPIGQSNDVITEPQTNDKRNEKNDKQSLTIGLVFMVILLLFIFAGILILFLCYIRRGRRLREKARRQSQGHSINHRQRGYDNPTYNVPSEYGYVNTSLAVNEQTSRPSPEDIFTVGKNSIKGPDGEIYRERSVDQQLSSQPLTNDLENGQVSNYKVNNRESMTNRYQFEDEIHAPPERTDAVLLSTRSYGDNSSNHSSNHTQLSEDSHRKRRPRSGNLSSDESTQNRKLRHRRHSVSGRVDRPTSGKKKSNRSFREDRLDTDYVRPKSARKHVRAYSADNTLEDITDFDKPPIKERKTSAVVGHGSMVSLRQLDDFYGDDDTFAAVDVSSSRRKSIPISFGSYGSLSVKEAREDDDQEEHEKRRLEKRRRRKERARQKKMNASLPSLRGIDLENCISDDTTLTDRSHIPSGRYDPEDPRYSQRSSHRDYSEIVGTPRSSRRGHNDRPQSGKRPISGRRDRSETPRSSRRLNHDNQNSTESRPSHRPQRTRSSSLSRVIDDHDHYTKGKGNFMIDSKRTKRSTPRNRRSSDSSRASLRDRDFDSDEVEGEVGYTTTVSSKSKPRQGSLRRSASYDGNLDADKEMDKNRTYGKNRSKENVHTVFQRSGSKRALVRNMSQESFSSGAGPDSRDNQQPTQSRRGSTASLINVKPQALKKDSNSPAHTKIISKELNPKDGIPTIDILRLTSDSAIDSSKASLDSGAWSASKKATAEQSLDELVHTYNKVASHEMAFEMADDRKSGKEETDMNIMSIDFSNEEVFEV